MTNHSPYRLAVLKSVLMTNGAWSATEALEAAARIAPMLSELALAQALEDLMADGMLSGPGCDPAPDLAERMKTEPPAAFAEIGHLASYLLPFGADATDKSHDLSHLLRVWRLARRIGEAEGGDIAIIDAAVLLHDSINLPKDSPQRSLASQMSGRLAENLLLLMGWPDVAAAAVRHAVEAHSFSAKIEPTTIEAKIVQDADRLDATGLIGVARCFHVAGAMKRALYDMEDPRAERRMIDDVAYSIDHFQGKLLTLKTQMQTASGRQIAADRHEKLVSFRTGFLAEAEGIA